MIRTLPPLNEWLRANQSMFFDSGKATDAELAEQLLLGVKALGASLVSSLQVDGWCVVGSQSDWFVNASYLVPEDLDSDALVAFPELGQNCTRYEPLIKVFAAHVIVKNTAPVSVLKGDPQDCSSIITFLQNEKQWMRAIAFKGAAN